MIMPVGQRLLLPANPAFIWGSLVLAFFLNMFFNMVFFGRAAWAPDLLAIVLIFWTVHQTNRVGIGAAFVFGLLMDVHQGSLLGQHALAYIILSYFAITIHRRMLWFGLRGQALQILPLFVLAHAVSLVLRLLAGAALPSWELLLAPLLQSALWPLVSLLLFAPQHRAPNPDATRPI
ncbi:MAG: rod shape-determining protein MreD [Betaproteobacteria bacterium]|jgi:rod shape-determining protein MreD|nr:rod shape-determining protein MreD [Betaproteobacteria bacterium]